MTDLEIPADAGGQIISYGITAEDIEAMKQRYAVVRFDTPAEYKAGVAAIAEIRNTRTAIERRRTDLKRIHLETGRKIDAEAARWTALLEQVEAPLKEAKKAIDDDLKPCNLLTKIRPKPSGHQTDAESDKVELICESVAFVFAAKQLRLFNPSNPEV